MKTVKEVLARIDHLREKDALIKYVAQSIQAFSCSDGVKDEVEVVLQTVLVGVEEEMKALSGVGVKRVPKTKKRAKK